MKNSGESKEIGKLINRAILRLFDWKEIRYLLKKQIAVNLAKVFLGTGAAQVIGFATLLLLGRSLSRSDFGIFSFSLSLLSISTVLASVGLNVGATRYASLYLEKGDIRLANGVLKSFLKARMWIAIGILLLVIPLANILATVALGKQEIGAPIRLVALGLITVGLLEFAQINFQAREQFTFYVSLKVSLSALKFGSIVFLLMARELTALRAIAIWIAAPLVSFSIGTLFMPGDLWTAPTQKRTYLDLYHFGRWLFLSSLANLVYIHGSNLILARYAQWEDVGAYSAVSNLIRPLSLLTNTMVTVFIPYASRLQQTQQFRRFILLSAQIGILISLILSPAALFSKQLLHLAYGDKWLDAAPILIILLIANICPLIYGTLSCIFLGWDKPQLLAIQNCVQAGIGLPLFLFLIPALGAVGAALSTLIIQIVGLLFVVALLVAYRHLWMLTPPSVSENQRG